MRQVALPRSYREWKERMEVDGRVHLGPEFIATRIIILNDETAEETRAFRSCYGDVYRRQVVGWFQMLQAEMLRRAH